MCERYVRAKRKYDKIRGHISKTCQFTFAFPRPQTFSLPMETILNIFYQKISPYFLLKLYQTCKYFFKKRMILPIITPSVNCTDSCIFSRDISRQFDFNNKVLFWFCENLSLYYVPTSRFERIYACPNLKILKIVTDTFSLNEFNLITAESLMIEEFYFRCAEVIDSNGSNVPFNVILEKLPYCIDLDYRNDKDKFSRETLLAMNKIKFKNRFIYICIYLIEIDKTFDAEIFWQFYQQNIDPDAISTTVVLSYLISENIEEIKNMLQNAHNKVFSTWTGKKPRIF